MDSSNSVQKSQEFRRFIEKEVIKIISDLAGKPNIDEKRIRGMAQITFDLIRPGMTLEQLYQNAVKLDDQYPELAPVVFKIMKEYEERYEKKALEIVSQLIRQGQFDQAQAMIKKVLQFKVVS